MVFRNLVRLTYDVSYDYNFENKHPQYKTLYKNLVSLTYEVSG